MTSTNFCYFLQGLLEVGDPKTISAKDLQRIKGHLQLVFRDEIDPSMGNAKHQKELNDAHNYINTKIKPEKLNKPTTEDLLGITSNPSGLMRC